MGLGEFGQSSSSSRSSGRSYVDRAQQPFFKSLWGQGAAALSRLQPGQSAAFNAPQIAGLQRDFTSLGSMTDPTANIAAQDASLASGLGRTFRDQIMPGIKSNAIMAGGFGGGRQGVAEGVAAGQIADAFTEGHGQIVANANQQALAAAQARQGQAGAIYDLGMNSNDFAPLMQMKNLLGPANVLNRTKGRQSSSSYSFGF